MHRFEEMEVGFVIKNGLTQTRSEKYTSSGLANSPYGCSPRHSNKLGNIQELAHRAIGHSNQDFVRNYDYSGDFNNNQLKQFTYGGNTYSYLHDAAGNVIQESSNRYFEWTHNDKPATFSNQAGTSDPTVYTNYFYNAAGERVKKLVKKGQQLEVTFYMDGGLFETSYVKPTGGSIDNNRFYNTLHVLDGNSRISTIRVGTDADDSTPAIKYFLEDHLMDSLVVLKSDGSLINREEFYPFGETSFGGYGKKRYRFNGKEKDEESGLYNYGQRYYAPWLCRFVSVDPIAEDFPFYTSYNYAGNKPVSKVDLEGLQESGSPQTLEKRNSDPSAENITLEKNHGQNDASLVLINDSAPPVHKVKEGDTLSQIAADNNISVESLRDANNLDPANDRTLQIGTELSLLVDEKQSAKMLDLSSSDTLSILDRKSSIEKPEGTKRVENGAAGYQFSLTLASPGGGYTIAFGYLGNANSENLFFSHGPAYGLEASAAYELFVVQSEEDFNPEKDFSGTSYTLGGGGTISGFKSGDATSAYPEDIIGRKYMAIGGGASIGLGGSVSKTKTTTFEYPSRVMDPEQNPGHWMNGMKQ